jgi:integrase
MAVLAECPACHNKQATKNKACSCGENLDAAKRSNRVRYWVSYRLPGGKKRKEYVGTSIEEARDADGKRRAQKREGRFFEMLPGADTTVAELVNWYLNLKSVKKLATYGKLKLTIEKFGNAYGRRRVRLIKQKDLEEYQELLAEKCCPATIDLEFRRLKTMTKKAWDNDLVSDGILKAFNATKAKERRGDNARTRTVSIEEFLLLQKNASRHIRAMVTIAYHTGMRQADLRNLRWAYVDRENWFFRLPAEVTKEKKRRDIPIDRHVREVLASLPRAVHHDRVFTFGGQPIERHVSDGFRNACKKAGIPYGQDVKNGVLFRDLRASAKTNMMEAGIDPALRHKLLGHRPDGMDTYYLRIKDEHLREAMDRYTAWLEERTGVFPANAPQSAPQMDVTS